MEIKKEHFNILFMIWILLIALFLGLIYNYNENKNQMVAEAELQGYVCEKNVWGIYKRCYTPDFLNSSGYTPILNWSAHMQNQSGVTE